MRHTYRHSVTNEQLHARPTIWLPAIAMVAFMAIYLPIVSTLVQVSSPSADVAAAPVAKHTSAPASSPSTPAAPANPSGTGTKAVAAAAPNCTPLAFGQPAPIGLNSAADGLSVQADVPTSYQIYGNTAAQLRSQIERCAPGANGSTNAEFTGETSYNLDWQYSIVHGDSCSITDVKIGLHTAIALPYWQPTLGATSGLASRWQSFASGLLTHEQGHAAIDRQYATQLVNDLNAMGNIDCSVLNDTISGIINRDVAALNQANDSYDAQTGHGATQGAVLPTY